MHTTSINYMVEQISGSEDTAIKCIDSDETRYNFLKANKSAILVGDIYRAAYRSGDGICYPRYDLGTNSESLVFAKHIFEQAFKHAAESCSAVIRDGLLSNSDRLKLLTHCLLNPNGLLTKIDGLPQIKITLSTPGLKESKYPLMIEVLDPKYHNDRSDVEQSSKNELCFDLNGKYIGKRNMFGFNDDIDLIEISSIDARLRHASIQFDTKDSTLSHASFNRNQFVEVV
jgi:hypothetical protein